MTIGICDYGIGGIGLYKLIRKKTTADIIYFSDAGYTPYGKVPGTELEKRLEQVIAYFNTQGVSYVAVACNAASTVIPNNNTVTGIIEHGINMVLKINPVQIGIVGGIRTIESAAYKTALEKKGIRAVQQIAQQLSIRIEAGDIDSPELEEDIRNIFEPVKNNDHILLACTHYPAITDKIRAFTKDARLLDPAEEMSEWIFANWPALEGNSNVKWITTGDPEQMKMAAGKSFHVDIDNIEKIAL